MLGQRNDATIAARLIDQLDVSRDPEVSYAAGLIAGWCGRSGIGDQLASKTAWRSFLKAERYWRDHPEQLDSNA